MFKRCSRNYALNAIESNPEWRVLDLGCGSDGWIRADVYADIENHEDIYENNFVQTNADDTPFKDKEFDFLIATHIAEHVPDPIKFCKEMARISKRGYIEVPTPFFDNLANGNDNPPPHGHMWWVTFNDDYQYLDFKPRQKVMYPVLEARDTTYFYPFFRDQMVTGVYWEDEIRIRISKPIFSYRSGDSAPLCVLDYTEEKPNFCFDLYVNVFQHMLQSDELFATPVTAASSGEMGQFEVGPDQKRNIGHYLLYHFQQKGHEFREEMKARDNAAKSRKNNK